MKKQTEPRRFAKIMYDKLQLALTSKKLHRKIMKENCGEFLHLSKLYTAYLTSFCVEFSVDLS